jgi:L-2-hydroxyglutarate oxidase LhgO
VIVRCGVKRAARTGPSVAPESTRQLGRGARPGTLTLVAELERLDVAIVGAGVIGLAIARAFAREGRDVVVLEAERSLGMHASSRNSEVVHAGIYYKAGSLKARLCVAGKEKLYEYCRQAEVAHARVGKIIVATRDQEIPVLEALKAQANANGVHDLTWLDGAGAQELEPAVSCVSALLSPSTGIVDSHGLMTALRRDAVRHGAQVLLSTPVLGGQVHDDGVILSIGGSDPTNVLCRAVVNSAGLGAQRIAHAIAGMPKDRIPACFYAKGHYFVLGGPSPFRRLVYPVPVPDGLGVHVTLDLSGQVRFGPDVSWVDGIDYDFDVGRAASFYTAIRAYFPALADGALLPGYTGIRAKLGRAGAHAHDFMIEGPRDHGVRGLVNLFGIESPGLTASLAIADHVCALLGS